MNQCFDEFEFDAARLELRRSGGPVKADALVLRLLSALIREPGQLVSKRALIEQVWEGRAVSENVVTVAMVRLRRTLGHRAGEREFIQNVHGRGYRFVCAVVERDAPLEPLVPRSTLERDTQLFVGRETLLGRLRHALSAARSGCGGLCILAGEPGIGKTRAVEQLAREAQALGFALAWGYCYGRGQTPALWPFVQVLREVLAQSARAGLPALPAPLLRELKGFLPDVAVEEGAEPGSGQSPHGRELRYDSAAKYRAFDALLAALTQLAERTPCLIVLDDLHEADAASLEFLRLWADHGPRTQILVCGTTRRPDLTRAEENRYLHEVLAHRNCDRIELTPLGAAAVSSYVGSLLDDRDGRLSRAVLAKSEGNPFFMVALTGELLRAERADPDSLKVPDAALELVRQRVRTLDAEGRGVLSSAAVIGRSFDLALLAAVMGEDASTLMTALDAAVQSQVLVSAADSKTVFQFAHELLKEALYEGLAPAQLRSCHLRVAQQLERRLTSGAPISVAQVAHHFYAALPDGDRRAAVRYASLAADAAAKLYAYADAMRHLRLAREALELIPDASVRLRLTLLLNQALCARVCSSEAFEPLIRELIRFARAERAGDVLAEATLLLGPHPGFPSMSGSLLAVEEALALVPEEDPMHAALLARLATLGPLAYDAQKSRAQSERALSLGRRAGAPLAHHTACSARLFLLGGPAHQEVSAAATNELMRLCAAHGERLTVPPVLLDLHRSIRALQDGDLTTIATTLRCAETRSKAIHSQEILWHAQRFQALLQLNRGAAEADVLPLLHALHVRAEENSILGTQLLCVHDRALFGGRDALRGSWRSTLQLDAEDPPNIWSLKVRVLSHLGLYDDARATLQSVAPKDLARLPCDRDYLGTLGSLARVACELAANDYAEALYPLLAVYPEHFAAHFSFLCEGAVSLLLGKLSLLLGKPEHAAPRLQAAVLRSESVGLTRSAAEARTMLALCREASG